MVEENKPIDNIEVETPEEVKVEQPVETPEEVKVEQPVETAKEVKVEQPVETPKEVKVEQPVIDTQDDSKTESIDKPIDSIAAPVKEEQPKTFSPLNDVKIHTHY